MIKTFRLEVPTSLSAIKLKEYQQYVKILGENSSETDTDFVKLKTIQIFCRGTISDISKIPLNEIDAIYIHLVGLFDQYTPLIREFKMEDIKGKVVTFAFIPKLEDMSMGEFVDIDSNIGDIQTMHKAMAVLYRPLLFRRKTHYTVKPYKGYSDVYEAFKDMPLDVALGALVFFYRLGNELLSYLKDSLTEKAENKAHPLRKALEENGVGISRFTHSLKVMSEEWMPFPNYRINNV